MTSVFIILRSFYISIEFKKCSVCEKNVSGVTENRPSETLQFSLEFALVFIHQLVCSFKDVFDIRVA